MTAGTADTLATAADTPAVEEKLVRAWRRQQGYWHTRALAYLLPGAVGLFLFDLLLDWLLLLPGWARLLLLAGNAAALAWAGWHFGWRELRRYDAARVALQVERLHPGLQSLLVSYVQFDGGSSGAAHGSPRLIQTVRRQAVVAAGPLDFRGIVDFTRLRRPLLIAGAVLLLFAASTHFLGEFYRVLLVRLLNPSSTLGYPTRTTIESVTGDRTVPEGAALELTATAGGEVPAAGTLHVRHDGAGWEAVGLSRGEGATFRHTVARAARGFDYYFRLGDARSTTHRVTVIAPPRLVEARASLRFPAYVNRPPEEHDSLHLPALPAGTGLRLELRYDRELSAASLRPLREGARPLALEIDPDDPRVARLALADVARLAAEAPTIRGREGPEVVSYQLTRTERVHSFTFTDPTRYTLEVVPDRPPAVAILSPRLPPLQERLPATVKKVLTVTFEARDDYALSEAWAVFRVNDGPAVRRRLRGLPAGTKAETLEATWTLRKTLPELKEGDLLTCVLEVSDNRDGAAGANVGRSSPLRLAVVSEEEYLRYVAKQKERGFDRTRAAAREEADSSRKVKTLIPDEE